MQKCLGTTAIEYTQHLGKFSQTAHKEKSHGFATFYTKDVQELDL